LQDSFPLPPGLHLVRLVWSDSASAARAHAAARNFSQVVPYPPARSRGCAPLAPAAGAGWGASAKLTGKPASALETAPPLSAPDGRRIYCTAPVPLLTN